MNTRLRLKNHSRCLYLRSFLNEAIGLRSGDRMVVELILTYAMTTVGSNSTHGQSHDCNKSNTMGANGRARTVSSSGTHEFTQFLVRFVALNISFSV